MKAEPAWEDDRCLWKAYVLSLVLHATLFHLRGLALPHREDRFIEVDITHVGSPGFGGGVQKAPSLHTPHSEMRQKARPPAPSPDSIPVRSAHAAPEPEPESEPEAKPGSESSEYGLGDGSRNPLSQIPKLLNLSDLNAILKRFYPEAARSEGREATVVLDIHIDTDGYVTSVDVVRSGGTDFDGAAIKVALLLRFTPAFLGSQRVGVKMRQAIQFKLES